MRLLPWPSEWLEVYPTARLVSLGSNRVAQSTRLVRVRKLERTKIRCVYRDVQ